ncbi:MAG: hypothetical protein AB1631_23615 [Acidobacteriota bacterium]
MDLKPDEIIRQLEDLTTRQRLITLAIESCRKALINCAEEDEAIGLKPLKGYSLESIQLKFKKQSLVFRHDVFAHPYIETEICLCVEDREGICLNDSKPIGEYRLISKMDGEIEDDYLSLYNDDVEE